MVAGCGGLFEHLVVVVDHVKQLLLVTNTHVMFVDISLATAGKPVFPRQEVFPGSVDRLRVRWSCGNKLMMRVCFVNIALLFAPLTEAVLI